MLPKLLSFLSVAIALLIPIAADRAGESSRQDQDEAEATGLDVHAQMKNCKKCHLDNYEEWEKSTHAKSWKNPVFQEAIKNLPDKGEACARCHAPDSVLLTGVEKLPNARKDARDYGVNCLTCHMDGKKYFGPHASKGHGGVVVMPEYLDAKWCSCCHGQPEVNKAHDQWTSYLESPSAGGEVSCQECHMPKIEREMVKSKKKLKDVQPARTCRKHSFEGAFAVGKAEAAAVVEAKSEAQKLKVSVKAKTGHSLPASEGRETRLEIAFHDAAGAPVEGGLNRVWDYAKKDVLTPGEKQSFDLAWPAAAKATIKLDLVLLRAPGRDKDEIAPIARLEVVK